MFYYNKINNLFNNNQISPPFGSTTIGRGYSGVVYKYNFNGKELDAETNLQDYGFRNYDPKIGRFISSDPIAKNFAFYSPYQFAGNKPITSLDLDGLEDVDFRVIKENLPGGGTLVLVVINEKTNYNSHEGLLQIHFDDPAITPTYIFEWKELNDIFQTFEKNVNNREGRYEKSIGRSFDEAGYYFRTTKDIRKIYSDNIVVLEESTGKVEGVIKLKLLKIIVYEKETRKSFDFNSLDFGGSIGGSFDSDMPSDEMTNKYVQDVTNIIDQTLKNNGLNNNDVGRIKITMGEGGYNKQSQGKEIIKRLQTMYPNATIEVMQDPYSQGVHDYSHGMEFYTFPKQSSSGTNNTGGGHSTAHPNNR